MPPSPTSPVIPMSRMPPRAAFRSANTPRCWLGCAAWRLYLTSSPFRPRPYRSRNETTLNGTGFNADELMAQGLAGGGPRGSGIREFMPEQHRHFFSQLPYVFAGAVDLQGWPLATLLAGQPGFVQSPDPHTLHIAMLPDAEDPANEALSPDREIGILGIDLSTRRRNRANGRIVARDSSGIRIVVGQSFGNCPQYIQTRALAAPGFDPGQSVPRPVEPVDHLDLP